MTVTVQCPECESLFYLKPDVIGSPMRCPSCDEVFVATEWAASEPPPESFIDEDVPVTPSEVDTSRSRADTPEASYQTGSVTDFLEVLPADIETQPEPEPAEPSSKPREVVWSDEEAETPSSEPEPPERSEPVEGPGPREVHWSEVEATPEPVAVADTTPPQEGPAHPPTAYVPRKRGSAILLWSLMLASLVGVGVGIYLIWPILFPDPGKLWQQARTKYENQDYTAAAEISEQLLAEFPDDPRHEEWRFFHELTTLRGRIYSVTIRTDPAPASDALTTFVRDWADSRFLIPSAEDDQNYPVDLWNTVQKLTEELAGKAEDTLKKAKSGATAGTPIEETESLLVKAENLYPLMDRYRPENFPLEDVRNRVNEVRAEIEQRREYEEAVQAIVELMKDPTDENIGVAERRRDTIPELAQDERVTQAFREAERIRLLRVQYLEDTREADDSPRDDDPPGLLFVPRMDSGFSRAVSRDLLEDRAIFFALARGILYALDEHDGEVLWASRVGIDTETLPVRVPATVAGLDIALIASNRGEEPGLTARLARNGTSLWHQPLNAPCLGQPLMVGKRVYVPVADDEGSIYEFEVSTGYRLGRIITGRRLAGGGVFQNSTGMAFFPAAARVLFAFDVASVDASGQRLPPRTLGVWETNHPEGSLRGEPVLIPAEVTGLGSAHVVLCQTEGLEQVRIRAFPLPLPGSTPPDPWEPAADLPLKGWNWFTPYHDLEKLAVVTDRGAFGLFGIRQAGTSDPILFPLPPKPLAVRESVRPTRGQVVSAREDRFWVLTDGRLHQPRLAFTFGGGLGLIDDPAHALSLGAPLHASQINPRGDRAVVVTRSKEKAASVATAIDLNTGTIVWKRQLGLIASRPPLVSDDQFVIVDEGGGLYVVRDVEELRVTQDQWLIDERWKVASPIEGVIGEPQLFTEAPGVIRAVLPVRLGKGFGLVFRTLRDGKLEAVKVVPLDFAPAGRVVPLGDDYLTPLANGTIDRVDPIEGTVAEGPNWHPPGDIGTTCHLTVLDAETFIATDGRRTIARGTWPKQGGFRFPEGTTTLRSRLISAPIVFTGTDGPKVVTADRDGVVTLLDPYRFGTEGAIVRTWRADGSGDIPRGDVTAGPFVLDDGTILFGVAGRHLIGVRHDTEQPIWVHDNGNLVGEPVLNQGKLWIASEAGGATALDIKTGKRIAEATLPAGLAATVTPIPLGPDRLLLPLTDGTVALPGIVVPQVVTETEPTD